MAERDGHHVLHYKQEWRLRPEAKKIREHESLIPTIDRSLHNEIHKECPPVPMLGYHALKRTGILWVPSRDTLESIDNLLFAIDRATQTPRTHRIERELGLLTIEAIELQKPFLKEGLQ